MQMPFNGNFVGYIKQMSVEDICLFRQRTVPFVRNVKENMANLD